MREMKNSGVEWIGQVPSNWIGVSLRHLLLSRDGGAWGNEPNNDNRSTICLRVADFDFNRGRFKKCSKELLTRRQYSESQVNNLSLKYGDILVEKSGGGEKTPVGRAVLYCNEYGPVLYANFMERLRFDTSKVLSEYIEYWLRAWYFCRSSPYYINQTIGIQNLNLGLILSKEKVFFAHIENQKRVADFLDEKCSEIDALTEDIKTQIETLEQYKKSLITETVTKGLDPNVEMKDSGIKWIGKIPINWKITRIKYICDFAPHCNISQLRKDSTVGYAPMECIKNGYAINRTALLSEIPASLTPFENGDIVMAKVTPCFENGNIAIINNSKAKLGFGSSELYVFRATKINTRFLFYWLRNNYFIEKAISTMTGMGGLKRVSPYFVKNAPICFPSIEEQTIIADFLDSKCSEIDAIISNKQEQLSVLDSYKKSLIYEYVTGKKEVPAV